MPSRISCQIEPASSAPGSAASTAVARRIASRQATDSANVAASAANAQPGPATAITAPPTIGPKICSPAGRTNWSSEFAATRSSSGTSCGTSASNAGPKKPAAAPYTAVSVSSIHNEVSAPVRQSTASPAITRPRTTSEASITRLGSKRSLITPPSSRVTTCGRDSATPTADIAAGTPNRSYTCQARATRSIPSPISDALMPVHSSRNCRWRNGASGPALFIDGGASRPRRAR